LKTSRSNKTIKQIIEHLKMQPISYKIKKTKTNKQTNKQKKEELLSNKLTHE